MITICEVDTNKKLANFFHAVKYPVTYFTDCKLPESFFLLSQSEGIRYKYPCNKKNLLFQKEKAKLTYIILTLWYTSYLIR